MSRRDVSLALTASAGLLVVVKIVHKAQNKREKKLKMHKNTHTLSKDTLLLELLTRPAH